MVALKGAAQRRELPRYRPGRAPAVHAIGGALDLIEAAMYTGCRADELTSARRSAFDARTRTLAVSRKTGNRTWKTGQTNAGRSGERFDIVVPRLSSESQVIDIRCLPADSILLGNHEAAQATELDGTHRICETMLLSWAVMTGGAAGVCRLVWWNALSTEWNAWCGGRSRVENGARGLQLATQ